MPTSSKCGSHGKALRSVALESNPKRPSLVEADKRFIQVKKGLPLSTSVQGNKSKPIRSLGVFCIWETYCQITSHTEGIHTRNLHHGAQARFTPDRRARYQSPSASETQRRIRLHQLLCAVVHPQLSAREAEGPGVGFVSSGGGAILVLHRHHDPR